MGGGSAARFMLCMAVFSFLPALRLGLINLEGYIAFSLFPHLSAIPPQLDGWAFPRGDLPGSQPAAGVHEPATAVFGGLGNLQQRTLLGAQDRAVRSSSKTYEWVKASRIECSTRFFGRSLKDSSQISANAKGRPPLSPRSVSTRFFKGF